MGQIDGDRRAVALRVEDREADVSRDSRLAKIRHERVAEHRATKVAAGNGRQVLVAFVDHDGMLRSEKILDSRIDRALTQHDLVGRGGIHGCGRGHRSTLYVDTAANAAERE